MSLPSTGELSFSAIRTELGLSGAISLNNASVRGLAGKASGPISFSDLRGKSNAKPVKTVTASYNVNTSVLSDGKAVIPAESTSMSTTVATLSGVLSCNFTLVFNAFVRTGPSSSTPRDGSLQLKILDASTNAVLASSAIATKSSAAGLVLTANFSGTTAIGVKLVLEAMTAVLPSGRTGILIGLKLLLVVLFILNLHKIKKQD